jgi:hypothetical protein
MIPSLSFPLNLAPCLISFVHLHSILCENFLTLKYIILKQLIIFLHDTSI